MITSTSIPRIEQLVKQSDSYIDSLDGDLQKVASDEHAKTAETANKRIEQLRLLESSKGRSVEAGQIVGSLHKREKKRDVLQT